MRPLDLEIPHHRGDVVDRELPAIQRCIFGDVTGWVASGIVGNATVATGEVTHLGFPTTDVRGEFMNEDDRITVTTLLEIELHPASIDIWHRFSSPIRNLRVRVQRQKSRSRCNRSALGIVSLRSMRGITDARGVIAAGGARSSCRPHRTCQSPSPRFRPKLQSTPPLGSMTPETWRPSCCSSAGRQGTSWKPRPSSIIANRPELKMTRCR